MTYSIGAVLILLGIGALSLYPRNNIVGPLLIVGAVVLVLRFTGAL